MIRVTLTVAAVLLAVAARAADGVPPPAPTPARKPPTSIVNYLWKKMTRVARLREKAGRVVRRLPSRLPGLLRAACVSRGMTEEQVTRIIGKPTIREARLVGGLRREWWVYSDPEFSVEYDNLDPCTGQPTDTLRVLKVRHHCALWD